MKHLTIFCSTDLDDRVVSALDEAGVMKFLRTDATGNRFTLAAEFDHAAISGRYWAVYRNANPRADGS